MAGAKTNTKKNPASVSMLIVIETPRVGDAVQPAVTDLGAHEDLMEQMAGR